MYRHEPQGLIWFCLCMLFCLSKPWVPLTAIIWLAARMLTGTRKHEHITPVLFSLHWLPVRFQIEFKLLWFVFKSLNGLAPPYLADKPTRSLRSSDQLLLTVPRSRLKLRGDRAFSVVAPRLWNYLPLYVKAAPTIFTFKTRIKINLLSQAFNSTGFWGVSLNF